jgi:hypothetical protein
MKSSLTGGGSAILDLIQAANEDAAELDEAGLQPVPGFAVLGPSGIKPPHTRIRLSRPIRVFAGQDGLADPAEAVDRGGLSLPQHVADLDQFAGAAGKARRRPDLLPGAEHGARGTPILPRPRPFALAAAGRDRRQHDVTQQIGLVPDRHQVPIGERRQETARRAFGHAQHDQPRLVVERVGRDGVQPLGLAMLAGEIFVRKQRDHPGAARQRLVHPFHEIAVGEIPLLQHHPVPGVFQDAADSVGERRVGAGPADEEIRKAFHGAVVPSLT